MIKKKVDTRISYGKHESQNCAAGLAITPGMQFSNNTLQLKHSHSETKGTTSYRHHLLINIISKRHSYKLWL